MKSGKVWGSTKKVFELNNISFHRIEVNKNTCCSKHYHDYRYNLFYVEKGKLLIKHWQTDYDLVDETILSDGESCVIPPKNFHQFVGLEDTVAYEIYYTLINDQDIVRENCGSNNYETHSNSK
jgi:quercetin dioxygenase-like cupin family protein